MASIAVRVRVPERAVRQSECGSGCCDAVPTAGYGSVPVAAKPAGNILTVAVVMCSKKLNPCMTALIEGLGVDTVYTGSLGSVFGIVSAILILPLGALQAKFSAKWLAVISLALLALGSLLGAVTSDPGMFMAWRVVEGVGYTGIYAIGGALITRWFDDEHSGVPMGLFTMNTGIAQTVIFNAAPPIMAGAGWQGVWIFTGVVAIVAVVGFIFLVKDWPRGGEEAAAAAAAKRAAEGENKASIMDAFKVPIFWLMCVMFFCFGVGMQGTMMFSNMIFTQEAGVDNATASLMSSLMATGQMITPLLGGFVISYISKKHKELRGWLCAIFFMMAFVSEFCLLAFTHDVTSAWVTSALMGFCVTWWPPILYLIAADHAPSPALAALGMTMFLFGQFAAGIVGPFIMGWFNATFGTFTMAKWLTLAIAIVGAIASFACAKIDSRLCKKQMEEKLAAQ